MGAVLQQVHQGMCDDLNTPLALAALSAPLKAMNDLLSTKKGRKAKGRLHTLAQYQLALQETFRLLGMQVTDPQKQLDQMRQLALSRCVCSTACSEVHCFCLYACVYFINCAVIWVCFAASTGALWDPSKITLLLQHSDTSIGN